MLSLPQNQTRSIKSADAIIPLRQIELTANYARTQVLPRGQDKFEGLMRVEAHRRVLDRIMLELRNPLQVRNDFKREVVGVRL